MPVVGKKTTKAAQPKASPKSTSDKWSIKYTDDEDLQHFSVLVCGYSGSGKTHFSGTAPSPLYVDADHGLRTVAHAHFPVIEFERGDEVWRRTHDLCVDIKKRNPPFDKLKIETVVFDSATTYTLFMEHEILAHPPDGKRRDETLFIGDYNLIKQRMFSLLEDIKRMSLNVVMTAGLVHEKDETTGELHENPDCTGRKIGPVLPGAFDYVFRMERNKEGVWYARTVPTTRFPYAKGRIPGGKKSLPELIKDPTWDKIVTLSK